MKGDWIRFNWFLLRNGALLKYHRNITRSVRWIIKESDSYAFISGAFRWSKTPERIAYWSLLNIKWLHHEGKLPEDCS